MRRFYGRPGRGGRGDLARRGGVGALLVIAFLAVSAVGAVGADIELSLPAAIRLAQEHSKTIESARHDSTSAVFRYRESRAAYFPTLSLGATAFYKDELQTIDIPPTSLEIGSHDNYQADVRLTLPLYVGGRTSNRVQIDRRNIEIQRFNLAAERLQNAYRTRRAYLTLLTAQSIAQAAEASLRRVTIIEGDVRNLFENGLADSLDLLDAGLAVREAMQLSDEKKTACDNAALSLGRLVGTDPADRLTLVEPVPPPAPDDRSAAPADREIARPEILLLDGRIRSAELTAQLEKSQYFPVLNGFGAYSTGKPNQDFFRPDWNDYFSVGVSLNWEFNLGGKTGNRVNAALQAAESAKMLKKDLEESYALQAGQAVRSLRHAYETYVIAQEKYDIARHKFRLATEKQREGHLSVNRLLELEAELTAIEQEYLAAKSGYYVVETELLYATGSEEIYGGL
jgi:outer membrane protein